MKMKKDFKIEFYKEALNDIIEIEEYIIEEYCDIIAARKTIDRLFKSIKEIPPFVFSYPKVNNKYLKNENVYKKICGKFLIVFRIDNDIVEIIGIFTTARAKKNIINNLLNRITQKKTSSR